MPVREAPQTDQVRTARAIKQLGAKRGFLLSELITGLNRVRFRGSNDGSPSAIAPHVQMVPTTGPHARRGPEEGLVASGGTPQGRSAAPRILGSPRSDERVRFILCFWKVRGREAPAASQDPLADEESPESDFGNDCQREYVLHPDVSDDRTAPILLPNFRKGKSKGAVALAASPPLSQLASKVRTPRTR